ncbi:MULTISPECIES: EndoS/ChiA family endoglycosidase [Sphingobacterium]|uniref:mannosyl-glycoprotein endo-beta-N-acetylglucosaminidase n=1 Tax=Sphingobacterium populi TaxID=1812824 RepID=A0ABW5UEC9_9SPHI|nr:glycosyl hydrolase family 18 protein [Sphingobacterium sp. CFCC 11742]
MERQFKSRLLLLAGSMMMLFAQSCNKNTIDSQPNPDDSSNINLDRSLPQYMAWWGGFNTIHMPLDSVPDGVNIVNLFLLELDPRPEVALDTSHITMQDFTWADILAGAKRLQARGIKVVATIMDSTPYLDRSDPNSLPVQYGFPGKVINEAFALGAITEPEIFAATVKRRVIDEWGLDGIDFDLEEEIGAFGVYNATISEDRRSIRYDRGNISNSLAVFKALSKYFGPKSGTDKLLIVDRGRRPMEIIPAAHEYFDYIFFQAYNWNQAMILQAYELNKDYFQPSQMYFTLNGQRAINGYDESRDYVRNGFTEYGNYARAASIADEFSKIKLPGQELPINFGIYQIAGDWSLGFPMMKAVFNNQGKDTLDDYPMKLE